MQTIEKMIPVQYTQGSHRYSIGAETKNEVWTTLLLGEYHEDAEELDSAALCNSHIEHFHLNDSGMRVDGTTTLVPFLERSAKLHCIKLEGSFETAEHQRLTAQVLRFPKP